MGVYVLSFDSLFKIFIVFSILGKGLVNNPPASKPNKSRKYKKDGRCSQCF